MNRVIAQQGATVLELDVCYESLDQTALLEFGGTLLSEASHAQPPQLILDLSQTSFIGSSFIELLIRAWKRLKDRGGSLSLCGVQPFCAEVLKVTRLDTVWPIYADRREALAALTISDMSLKP